MSKKITSEYREGTQYDTIFNACQKMGIVTIPGLIEQGYKAFDVRVVTSPRPEGTSKNPWGSYSARSEDSCFLPLKKKKGEPQRFRLSKRVKTLAPRKRETSNTIAAKKEKRATKRADAKASTNTVNA